MKLSSQNPRKSTLRPVIRIAGWSVLLIWLLAHAHLFFDEVSDDVTGLASVRPLILILLVLLIGVCLLLNLFLDRKRSRLPNGETLTASLEKKHTTAVPLIRGIMTALVLAANSLFSYWLIELISKNKDWTIRSEYVFLNWLITLMIYLFLILITNSLSIGMIIGNFFFVILSMVNYYVYLYRGIPFQIVDVTGIQTAVTVTAGYDIVLTWQMVTALTVTFCISSLYMELRCFHNARSIPGKLLSRLLAIGVGFAFYGIFLVSPIFTFYQVEPYFWRPNDSYNSYGLETAFLAFAREAFPTKPDTYSEAKTASIEADYPANANTADDDAPENIIVVMNESFSDLEIYPNVEVNTNPMPFLRSLTENTQTGPLLVSVQGGYTANTEYEFLTGNSMMLSPNSIPYTTYIQDEQYTVATILEQQGYRTEAIHPYYPTGWRRDTNYPLLGLSDFRSLEDFKAFGYSTVRGFVSDESDVDYLIHEVASKEEGEKLFLFNVTMQNHGGYTYDGSEFQNTVHLVNYEGTEEELAQAEQYLTLVSLTDQSMEKLITYFENSDEKTLILFFGDHQPSITNSFYEEALGKAAEEQDFSDKQLQYETVYYYWANYDIPESTGEMMSANYLGAHLLELAGLTTSGYEDYLTDLRDTLPAMNAFGYLGTDGEQHVYGSDDETTEISDLLEDYRCLIYNELTAGKKRNESFFGVAD